MAENPRADVIELDCPLACRTGNVKKIKNLADQLRSVYAVVGGPREDSVICQG